jgi:putative oligomerization/nucleic acid binding protein
MKQAITKWIALVAITGVLGGLLCGCAWSIGGSDKAAGKVVATPTRGQELIDLKKAKDQGAISDEEYQAQRKAIMEK